MKILLLGFTVFIVVRGQLLSKEELAKVRALQDACAKETSVDKKLVEKAMVAEYVDDSKLKDYIFCCNKGLGFQNDAGDIMEEKMVKRLVEKFKNEQIVNNAVKQCSQKKATPSETGFELAKCLHAFAPKDMDIVSMLL